MDQNIECRPACLKKCKAFVNIRIAANVHDEGDIGSQLFGQGYDPIGHALDMRKGEFRALAMHGLGNTPRNGTIRGEAHDQRALAAQKPHKFFYPCWRLESTYITSRCPAFI